MNDFDELNPFTWDGPPDGYEWRVVNEASGEGHLFHIESGRDISVAAEAHRTHVQHTLDGLGDADRHVLGVFRDAMVACNAADTQAVAFEQEGAGYWYASHGFQVAAKQILGARIAKALYRLTIETGESAEWCLDELRKNGIYRW